MKFFVTSFVTFLVFFQTRLKIASSAVFWIVSALLPLVVLVMGVLFGTGLSSIQVGVYGGLTSTSVNRLLGDEFAVVRYYDREQLRLDVASRRIELGYAILDDGIFVYVSPATVTDRVANLIVAAAHLEAIAGEIGAASLFVVGMEADAGDVQARVDEILADGPLMNRVVIVYDVMGDGFMEGLVGAEAEDGVGAEVEVGAGAAVGAEVVPFRRLFHGLLALFAQLIAMLCALRFTGLDEREVSRQVKLLGKGGVYALSGLAVVFVLTGLIMFFAILPVAWMFPGVWVVRDVLPAIFYLLAVCAGSVILAAKLPAGTYPAVLVMAFVFTTIMGGVIFDLREVLYNAAFLRFLFPSFYYMALLR